MKKLILVSLGFLLASLAIYARMSVKGWLLPIGILSSIVFGILHAVYLGKVLNFYVELNNRDKNLILITILVFPLIFLFQFEIDDSSRNYYIFEFFTNIIEIRFKDSIFVVSIFACFVYLNNYIKLVRKIKNIKSNNHS